MNSPPSASVATTGRLTIAPVPRIADVPAGTIGVSKSAPPEPVLVTVNVAPLSSSGVTLLSRVRAGEVGDLAGDAGEVEVARVADHRARRDRASVSTAMPTFSSPW